MAETEGLQNLLKQAQRALGGRHSIDMAVRRLLTPLVVYRSGRTEGRTDTIVHRAVACRL